MILAILAIRFFGSAHHIWWSIVILNGLSIYLKLLCGDVAGHQLQRPRSSSRT